MNNNEIITHANLMIRIAAADKDELFRKMAKKAAELPPVKQGGITDQTIFEALRKREEQFSTALGRGVIFPHARFSGLHSHAVIVVATLSGTLKCETPDNTPVRIACLLLIPEEQPMQGLKFISARFLACISLVRKEQSCKNRNNNNHNQKFDQSKFQSAYPGQRAFEPFHIR